MKACPSLCLSWLATVALCGGATGVAMAVEVDVSVHGTPLHMQLDTEVNPSVIDLTTADKLGLPVDRGDGGEASGFGDDQGAAVYPATVVRTDARGQTLGFHGDCPAD